MIPSLQMRQLVCYQRRLLFAIQLLPKRRWQEQLCFASEGPEERRHSPGDNCRLRPICQTELFGKALNLGSYLGRNDSSRRNQWPEATNTMSNQYEAAQ